jgi:DHA1 family bicyclomycin/chloramphenicol resistance-like MFS transporter
MASARVTLLLAAVVGIGALSIDMFLPSLPSISREFGSRPATVQLAITLFLMAYAGSQIVFGPLSDRFGRRPMLLAGLALYLAGAVACFLAPSVEVLIAARIVQGVGAGSGPVVGRAIVRDVYPRERAARVLAVMGTAQALTPILAPILGGTLHRWFGWHSVFAVLAGFGLVFLTGCWLWVRETLPAPDLVSLHPARLAGNVRGMLRHPGFLGYVLLATLIFSGQFAFISGSAFVLIDLMHLSPDAYGFGFGLVACGIMAGSFLSARYTPRLGIRRMILSGAGVAAVAGTAMAALAAIGWASPAGVIGPMLLYAISVGLVLPNAIAGAISPFPHAAGLASAVIGFLMMTGSAGYSIAVSGFYDGTARPMTGAIALCGTAALIGYAVLLRSRD